MEPDYGSLGVTVDQDAVWAGRSNYYREESTRKAKERVTLKIGSRPGAEKESRGEAG